MGGFKLKKYFIIYFYLKIQLKYYKNFHKTSNNIKHKNIKHKKIN